jgi:hypothetical protein
MTFVADCSLATVLALPRRITVPTAACFLLQRSETKIIADMKKAAKDGQEVHHFFPAITPLQASFPQLLATVPVMVCLELRPSRRVTQVSDA